VRSAAYGKGRWGDAWPFLSHEQREPSTADHAAWHRYFAVHLGGFPKGYRAFMDRAMKHYNLPEVLPELFDDTWRPPLVPAPAPRWKKTSSWQDLSPDQRREVVDLFFAELRRAGFGAPPDWPSSPAEPGTIFDNYAEALARHGRHNISGAFDRGGYLGKKL